MCYYEKGEDENAICTLESFIHLAEKMKECKKISADEAGYMIREAQKIVDQMDEGDVTDNGIEVSDNGSDSEADNVTEEVCEETKPVCKPECEENKPVEKPICEKPKPECGRN